MNIESVIKFLLLIFLCRKKIHCNQIKIDQELKLSQERCKWRDLEKQRESLTCDIRRLQDKISIVKASIEALKSTETEMKILADDGSKLGGFKNEEEFKTELDQLREAAELLYECRVSDLTSSERQMQWNWTSESFNFAFIYFLKGFYLTPNQEDLNIYAADMQMGEQRLFDSLLKLRKSLVQSKTAKLVKIDESLRKLLSSAEKIDSTIRNGQEYLVLLERRILDRELFLSTKEEEGLMKTFFDGQKKDWRNQLLMAERAIANNLQNSAEKDWNVENGSRLKLRRGNTGEISASQETETEKPETIPKSLINLAMTNADYKSQVTAKTEAISNTGKEINSEHEAKDANSYILNWHANFIIKSREFYENQNSKLTDMPLTLYEDLTGKINAKKCE